MVNPSGRSSASAPIARKPADERRDAIALLDPQLAGARHRDAAAERAERGEHGQLVDHLRHFLGRDVHGRSCAPWRIRRRPTGSPLSRSLHLRSTIAPKRRSTSRMAARLGFRPTFDRDVRAEQGGGGDGQERGRRDVAGHAQVARPQSLAAAHRDRPAFDRGRRAERRERALRMITGSGGLDDRGLTARPAGPPAARRSSPGRSACRAEVDAVQRAAVDDDRRPVAVGGLEAGAHLRQGRRSCAASGGATVKRRRRASIARGGRPRRRPACRMVLPELPQSSAGRRRSKPAEAAAVDRHERGR